LSSSTRRGDRVGDFIEELSPEHGIEELASVETVLASGDGALPGSQIPVRIISHVSEVGVLELWCVSRDGNKRWKLEYNIRERTGSVDGGELLEEAPSPELGDGS